jgi:hypothetical protein
VVDTHETKRIQQTNYERQALAASQGWGFAPDAPELLEKWPVKPFTEIGDKRIAFGVVAGVAGQVSFTAFDYHRRPRVTNWKTLGVTTMTTDTILIDTVWVITLPAPLPAFGIFDMAEPNFDKEGTYPPQTPDGRVNRSYRLVNTDLGLANQVLTPAVTGIMKQYKLHNWATWGDQLVCTKHLIFGRVKPDELSSKVGELGRLIAALPPHLWGAGNAAPHQAPPPPQAQYQQPYPPQGYPPQPQYQPQYQQPYPPQPQQPYPQQPYGYPQPGFPPQPHGGPGHPPPGYR